jgi:hypothetical protein
MVAHNPLQSSRIVARTGLRMMPTFPRSPLSFRTAGFPQYGWKVCVSDGTFPGASRLSSLPAYATSTPRLSPSFVSADQLLNSSSESGNRGHTDTAKSGRGQPAPQGSSLRFGLFCPNPSSLNRPHPPHSQARSDFAAMRLIPSAFAVRERLGDPRVVPNFRLLLSTNMSLSMTPEVQGLLISSSFTLDASLRMDLKRSASSSLPQSASRGARISGFPIRFRYDLLACSPPLADLTELPRPTETFTSRLSMNWSASSSLDIATAATGQFLPMGLSPIRVAA